MACINVLYIRSMKLKYARMYETECRETFFTIGRNFPIYSSHWAVTVTDYLYVDWYVVHIYVHNSYVCNQVHHYIFTYIRVHVQYKYVCMYVHTYIQTRHQRLSKFAHFWPKPSFRQYLLTPSLPLFLSFSLREIIETRFRFLCECGDWLGGKKRWKHKKKR